MKKFKYIFFLVIVICVFSFNMDVMASVLDNVSTIGLDCNTLLGDPKEDGAEAPMYWINWGLNLIKYIAIIALLVLVIIDFFKAMVEDDKDALKKALNKAIKRFIYCVIIFFIPIIVNLLFELFGISGSCDLVEEVAK